jgi:hypothetical protein
VYAPDTREFLRYRSAFMNTTAVKKNERHQWLSGIVRIDAGTWPRFDAPAVDLLQAKFNTDGVVQYKGTNRLMLRSRAAEDASVDQYLVCIKSSSEGMINFKSDWRCDAPALIFCSSYFRKMQETLLLLRRETTIRTSLGSWRIMCKDKTSFLGLVDDQ